MQGKSVCEAEVVSAVRDSDVRARMDWLMTGRILAVRVGRDELFFEARSRWMGVTMDEPHDVGPISRRSFAADHEVNSSPCATLMRSL
jgi:hypothetical protein